MPKELFPQGDSDFANSARTFVSMLRISRDKLQLTEEAIAPVAEAVQAYRDALAVHSNRYTKSMGTRVTKDRTRDVAEKLMRDAANRIRVNREIDPSVKQMLNIKVRPKKLKAKHCPQKAPLLALLGVEPATADHGGRHRIRFGDGQYDITSIAKPDGAERLELFVDLVPHNEPIPRTPGERLGGRRWYLGSFTRSPLTVEYPLTNEPMRVVYWGRWAAGNNDTGPDSATLVTKVEGCDAKVVLLGHTKRREQTVIVTSGRKALPDLVERTTIEGTEVNEQRLLSDERSEAA